MGVIRKPVITEKFTELGEELNQYAFICDTGASKQDIKREIEKVYNVKVDRVNTMIYPGKKKFRYTKKNIQEGKTSRFKKAVVKLKGSDTIDFYSNI